jgi:hypothetical protein
VARKRSLSRKSTPKKSRSKKSRPKISAVRRPSPSKKVDVARQEYKEIIHILNQRGEIIEGLRRELETQFKRMAQIQSELDEVRRVWLKNKD